LSISYAIDTLERDLGLSVFDRRTTGKPKLIQQGEAIASVVCRQHHLRHPRLWSPCRRALVFRHCAELIVAPYFSVSGNVWNSPSYRLYEHREMHPPSKGKAQLAVEGDSRMV
jgi:hypothetical protein